MSWKRQASSSRDFDRELPPAGNHPAVLVALVDLGTHEDTYGGESKMNRKVYLAWELTAEEGRPVVGRDFTFSLNAKALLRQFIQRWRGRDLAEGEEFDVSVLLGKPCMLSVVHQQKGDRTFAKVDGVAGVPKGMTVPDARREQVLWSVDEDGDVELPEWLPYLYGAPLSKWAQDCQEWRKGPAPSNPAGAEAGAVKTSNDDIPW